MSVPSVEAVTLWLCLCKQHLAKNNRSSNDENSSKEGNGNEPYIRGRCTPKDGLAQRYWQPVYSRRKKPYFCLTYVSADLHC